MGHALAELLEALINALSHSGEHLPRLLPQLVRFAVRFFEAAALPQTVLFFFLSLAASALGVGLWFLVHLLVGRLTYGRRKIFISYQHAHEAIAKELADALAAAGMQVTKLPFVDEPDHDELLDEFKRGIFAADVVLCLPEAQASFVENEVALAYGLNKPMVFFLASSSDGRLPKTIGVRSCKTIGVRSCPLPQMKVQRTLRRSVSRGVTSSRGRSTPCLECASWLPVFRLGTDALLNRGDTVTSAKQPIEAHRRPGENTVTSSLGGQSPCRFA